MDADEALWEGLEEHYVDLPTGVRLHYVAQGEGPLVVLVHGFPEHWYGWRDTIPRLAQAGFRVVAPDMRGYNRSSKPDEVEAYYAEVLGDDLGALIASLGGSAILVGHDWGAAASWFAAMRHPDAIHHLVILNMPHPAVFANAWKTFRQRLRSAYFYFFRLRNVAAFFYRRFFAFPQRFMLWFFAGRKPKWRSLDPYARAALRDGAMRAMMTYYTALLRRAPDDTLALVRPIERPVSILWGSKDPAFGKAMADPGDHVDRARLTIRYFDDLGHFLHLQDPERVSAAIADVVQQREEEKAD
ncbi:MAG: alpha/beta hydrolase [Myxococcota bacterium]